MGISDIGEVGWGRDTNALYCGVLGVELAAGGHREMRGAGLMVELVHLINLTRRSLLKSLELFGKKDSRIFSEPVASVALNYCECSFLMNATVDVTLRLRYIWTSVESPKILSLVRVLQS